MNILTGHETFGRNENDQALIAYGPSNRLFATAGYQLLRPQHKREDNFDRLFQAGLKGKTARLDFVGRLRKLR